MDTDFVEHSIDSLIKEIQGEVKKDNDKEIKLLEEEIKKDLQDDLTNFKKEQLRGFTGRDGKDGRDGRDGKDGTKGIDGSRGPQGLKGDIGRDGKDGADGVGIKSITVDDSNDLIVRLTNNKRINAGKLPSRTIVRGGGRRLGEGLNNSDANTLIGQHTETTWNKAISFNGVDQFLEPTNTSSQDFMPLYMAGVSSQVDNGTATVNYNYSNASNARPWFAAVIFKADDVTNTTRRVIWSQFDNQDEMSLNHVGSELRFDFGKTEDNDDFNRYIFAKTIEAGKWYGVLIDHDGQRFSNSNAHIINLLISQHMFVIDFEDDLITEDSTLLGSSYNPSGFRTTREQGTRFTVGARGDNTHFKGQIASCITGTRIQGNDRMRKFEANRILRDPITWYKEKEGQPFREPVNAGVTEKPGFLDSGKEEKSSNSLQIWLMGNGAADSITSISNQVNLTDLNNTPLVGQNMTASNIVDATIPTLTNRG